MATDSTTMTTVRRAFFGTAVPSWSLPVRSGRRYFRAVPLIGCRARPGHGEASPHGASQLCSATKTLRAEGTRQTHTKPKGAASPRASGKRLVRSPRKVARVILGRDTECERISSLVEGGDDLGVRARLPSGRPRWWRQRRSASQNCPSRGLEHLSRPTAGAASRRRAVGRARPGGRPMT